MSSNSNYEELIKCAGKPKTIKEFVEKALAELSCADFDLLKTDRELKEILEQRISKNPPYWRLITKHDLPAQGDHTALFSIFPQQRTDPTYRESMAIQKGDFFIKICIEKMMISMQLCKLEDSYKSELINEKKLDKKELFKDCQKFQDAFEDMLVIAIMNFN